jgi:hypothetical protein
MHTSGVVYFSSTQARASSEGPESRASVGSDSGSSSDSDSGSDNGFEGEIVMGSLLQACSRPGREGAERQSPLMGGFLAGFVNQS